MRFPVSCMAVACLSVLPRAARAEGQEPNPDTANAARPPFGRHGQLVLDEIFGLRASGSSLPLPADGSGGVGYAGIFGYSEARQSLGQGAGVSQAVSSSRIWFAPAFDYFVIDHLSLGVGLAFEMDHQEVTFTGPGVPSLGSLPSVSATVSAMPRVGWAFGVTRSLSVWPRLGVGYAHTHGDGAALGGPLGVDRTTVDGSAWVARADVGLVFDVMSHVFLSATPDLTLLVASETNKSPGSSGSANAKTVQAGGSVALGLVF